MTHDLRFPEEEFEDVPVEFEIAENPEVILELRFSGYEIREIGEESRTTGQKANDLVREYTLAAIRAKRKERKTGQAEVAD